MSFWERLQTVLGENIEYSAISEETGISRSTVRGWTMGAEPTTVHLRTLRFTYPLDAQQIAFLATGRYIEELYQPTGMFEILDSGT